MLNGQKNAPGYIIGRPARAADPFGWRTLQAVSGMGTR
jgi:hypothetical protein